MPGKFVIGLTGNIATGKSVVRRMLEHLGAYTIDADALSHRAMAKGAPGFDPVLQTFGTWILDRDGEINRSKLGEVVFRDPLALAKLETILHPLVGQAVLMLARRATQGVVVIEAIKLLESEWRKSCDSVWVTYAPEDVQIERLMRKRSLSEAQAQQRIGAQTPQGAKMDAANIVIRNTGSYDDLWKQVTAAWKQVVPGEGAAEPPAPAPAPATALTGKFTVGRGKPRDSEAIAELITRLSHGKQKLTGPDVMATFGDRAYMLLQLGGKLVGVAGWQVENLVARTTDLYLESGLDPEKALEALIAEVERASADLQCEASLVFPTSELARLDGVWKKVGYERRTPETLGIQAWQDAAVESMPSGSKTIFFKQLRQDRVLRPI